MKQLPQHTAVLIFSRTAREEAEVKQFGRQLSAAQNLKIAQLLIRRSCQIGAQSGLPVFKVSSSQQEGTTFGERFTNAIQYVFAKGYEHLIAIGTDCPGLSPQMLIEAAEQVEQGKLVAGADHTGGLYLLGLSHTQFCQAELLELPWQSGRDFKGIQSYADQNGFELASTCRLQDWDTAQDLQQILRRLHPHSRLARRLYEFLQIKRPKARPNPFLTGTEFPNLPFLRGPPQRTPILA